jgi:hypothetical protein
MFLLCAFNVIKSMEVGFFHQARYPPGFLSIADSQFQGKRYQPQNSFVNNGQIYAVGFIHSLPVDLGAAANKYFGLIACAKPAGSR